MGDYRLSKVQRNEVFKLIQGVGLDPDGFNWEDDGDGYGNSIHRIVHPETGSFLKIDRLQVGGGRYYNLDHWPHQGASPLRTPHEWIPLRSQITLWLAAVKAETDAPDLFEVAKQQREWLGGSSEELAANTPFRPTEIEQITQHLDTIKNFTIKTYELTAAHQEHVEERLAYLADAATRVGRYDWKNLAASAFIDIVLELGLDPDKAQKLFALTTQLLGPLVLGISRMIGA